MSRSETRNEPVRLKNIRFGTQDIVTGKEEWDLIGHSSERGFSSLVRAGLDPLLSPSVA